MRINPQHLKHFSPAMQNQVASAIYAALEKLDQQDVEIVSIAPMTGYYTSIVFAVAIRTLTNDRHKPTWLYFKLANQSIDSQTLLIEQEYQHTYEASEYFKNQPGLHTVEPILWLEDNFGFVMTELPGERFDKLLVRYLQRFTNAKSSKETMFSAFNQSGQWLNRYQNISIGQSDTLENKKSVQDILDYQQRVETLLLAFNTDFSGYLDPDDIEKIYQQCLSDLQLFSDEELKLVIKHNDFAPWNINLIVSNTPGQPNELVVFDFADVKTDSYLYDIYHFIRSIHLFKFKIFTNEDLIEPLIQSFLDGYGIRQNELSQHSARFFNLYFNLSSTLNLLRSQYQQKGVKRFIKRIAFQRYLKSYATERRNILK